jgi:hypothetical protein
MNSANYYDAFISVLARKRITAYAACTGGVAGNDAKKELSNLFSSIIQKQ